MMIIIIDDIETPSSRVLLDSTVADVALSLKVCDRSVTLADTYRAEEKEKLLTCIVYHHYWKYFNAINIEQNLLTNTVAQ